MYINWDEEIKNLAKEIIEVNNESIEDDVLVEALLDSRVWKTFNVDVMNALKQAGFIIK